MSLFSKPGLHMWSHQYQHCLGVCEKCKFLGPTPNLLNQKIWGGGLRICYLMNFSGVTDRCSNLRIIVLNDTVLPLENQIPGGATE